MRRALLLIAALALVAVACSAQVDEIHYLNTATLIWNPVTEDVDGTPFPVEFIVSYEVFMYNSQLSIDDQIPANLTAMGTSSIAELELDLSGFPYALYYAGVRYVVDNGQGVVTRSLIAWSYDPVATDPTGPFAYLHLEGSLFLPLPTGLRDSGM